MGSLQGDRQQTVRNSTGTALNYDGDWSALFDAAGIAAGPVSARLHSWINTQLGTSYPDLPGAMQAYAVNQGVTNWSSMGAFTISSSFILREDGSKVLREDGSRLVRETF